jgi:apolipoprotein D and lipocalin family protein
MEKNMFRNSIHVFTIVFIHSCIIFAQNDKIQTSPTTVSYVDIQRYSGLWYEIAKIPNSFQDQCAYGTTAEYIIDEEGNITVINKCYEEDGNLDVADGVANIVDKNTNAKLEVSFVSFLGIRPFWGDYWIIGLDEDYTYAVIGHPERKYGWILSRTSSVTEESLEDIMELLKQQGYNTENFEFTIHNE